MFRLFSLAAAERGRQKQRLELSLAGICELELLKRRHEALIISALALHTPEPGPESPARPHDDSNPRCPPEPSWSLMKLLQHQVGELKVDESLSDPADARPGSGSCEQTEGPCPDFSRPVRLSERPESVGDVFAGRELLRSPAPRCVSAGPCPLLEGLGVDEPWVWPAGAAEEEPEGHGRPQSVETYILGLIQRRSPLRSGKPRTSRGPEPRAVARQSSRREPEGEHQWPPRGPRPALAGIRDLPSGSEAESPQHTHSPSADELVNAQYIPAQPKHKAPKAGRSPERRPRAAPKKCRFTEEKAPPKKPSRRASRAQSENNLRGAAERRCGTAERSGTPRARRGPGHRRWRSTLELSQDEAEAEQPIRRSRQSKPRPPPAHPPGESESSLSEAESPASSSLSSDSDGSGGLVWPQQLAPPPPPGHAQQPKAFVKIKASHALKKKILRFRSGSLKVMTTV